MADEITTETDKDTEIADLQNRYNKAIERAGRMQSKAWDAERRLEVLTDCLRTIHTYITEDKLP